MKKTKLFITRELLVHFCRILAKRFINSVQLNSTEITLHVPRYYSTCQLHGMIPQHRLLFDGGTSIGARATRADFGSPLEINSGSSPTLFRYSFLLRCAKTHPPAYLSSSWGNADGKVVVADAKPDVHIKTGVVRGCNLLPLTPFNFFKICLALPHMTLVSINLSSQAEHAAVSISNLWFITCISINICNLGSTLSSVGRRGSLLSTRVPPPRTSPLPYPRTATRRAPLSPPRTSRWRGQHCGLLWQLLHRPSTSRPWYTVSPLVRREVLHGQRRSDVSPPIM